MVHEVFIGVSANWSKCYEGSEATVTLGWPVSHQEWDSECTTHGGAHKHRLAKVKGRDKLLQKHRFFTSSQFFCVIGDAFSPS